MVFQLHEEAKKVNSVERLTRHLNKGISGKTLKSYLAAVRRWIPATRLRNQCKGKIKIPLYYKGKDHDAYLSHVRVQITASRKDIYLVLVYELTRHPMML